MNKYINRPIFKKIQQLSKHDLLKTLPGPDNFTGISYNLKKKDNSDWNYWNHAKSGKN